MIDVLYKSRGLIVILKPAGMPTQSDTTCDDDAMTMTARMLSEQGEPSDLWLVHRLDRVVGGILVFARSR